MLKNRSHVAQWEHFNLAVGQPKDSLVKLGLELCPLHSTALCGNHTQAPTLSTRFPVRVTFTSSLQNRGKALYSSLTADLQACCVYHRCAADSEQSSSSFTDFFSCFSHGGLPPLKPAHSLLCADESAFPAVKNLLLPPSEIVNSNTERTKTFKRKVVRITFSLVMSPVIRSMEGEVMYFEQRGLKWVHQATTISWWVDSLLASLWGLFCIWKWYFQLVTSLNNGSLTRDKA